MMSARMDTACYGWGKRKAPLGRTFERQCPLSCELGPFYLGQRTPLGEARQGRL